MNASQTPSEPPKDPVRPTHDNQSGPPPDGVKDGREPIFTLPSVVMGLAITLFLIELASNLVLDAEGKAQFALWFGFIPVRLIYPDALPGGTLPLLWTSVTHAFLHAGWEHALMNIAWLAIFGTPVARRYGPIGFLAVFLISSVAGALAFSFNGLGSLQVLVGASGGIAGLTGAAVRFMFQPVLFTTHPETGERVILGRKLAGFSEMMANPKSRYFTIFWIAINCAAPLLPMLFGGAGFQIAWEAHLGGFAAGLILVSILERIWGRRTQGQT